MEITNVRVRKFEKGNLKGFASFTLKDSSGEDSFAVDGARIMSGTKGDFVSFPSTKTKTGEYKDTCFPLTAELRDKITQAVLKKYEETPNTTPKSNSSNSSSFDRDDLPF
jgi:stage V sporulation protein G